MYTLYKDRWILDENGVAIAQRCRGTTNEQWDMLLHLIFAVENVKEQFTPMLTDWRHGRPVCKLCYGLGNNHMEALDKLLENKS